ncbi:hypothetical protein KBC79_03985 [Candidatus Woesebacteria bacterium]|nr:hypothetical protein [Candidatus Woesebacteria bacterium]
MVIPVAGDSDFSPLPQSNTQANTYSHIFLAVLLFIIVGVISSAAVVLYSKYQVATTEQTLLNEIGGPVNDPPTVLTPPEQQRMLDSDAADEQAPTSAPEVPLLIE